MDFDGYQKRSRKTAIYPGIGKNFVYTVLGLTGEAGEVADKLKKIMRDNNGEIPPEKRTLLLDELSDVLWYLAACAGELGAPLSEIARRSLKKIEGRKRRGTLHGEGDVR